MPHHKMCKKRMITSQKANQVNRARRSQMKTAVKKVLAAKKKENAATALKEAVRIIDKNVKFGLVHKNNAANKKSMLHRAVGRLNAA